MKWHKRKDTFELSRIELSDLVTFAEYPRWLKPKARPIGWNKFKKTTLTNAYKVLVEYAKGGAKNEHH